MSEHWAQWTKQRGLGSPGGAFASPIGVMRTDAKTPGGGWPGSDPQFLIEHHLDSYEIDYAILTGSGILGISLQPDLDWANSTARAYNEALVAKWLTSIRWCAKAFSRSFPT